MATVRNEILDSFYERLSQSEEIDEPTVEALRILIQSEQKLRADDLVAILENAAKEAPP